MVLTPCAPCDCIPANIPNDTFKQDVITLLCAIYNTEVTPSQILNNNEWLQSRDFAGTGFLDLLKGDVSNNTILNALTGKKISFEVNEVEIAKVDSTGITSTGLSLSANLTFTAASAKIIPGATSLLFRNTTDAATNLSITNAGLVTVGVGNLALTAGNMTFGAASASIIPGATSLLIRNNANSVSNIIIADSGFLTSPVTTAGIIQGISAIPSNISSVTNTGLGLLIAKNTSSNSDNAAILAFGANAVGANFNGFKTRATDGNAGTVVQSGDTILQITGLGADGTVYRRAASIVMSVDGTPSSADMPGAIDLQCTPDGSATLASVLKLTNDKIATFTGDIKVTTAGKGLQVKSGSNAKAGTAVANGATPVTVSTTAFTANSTVIWGLKTVGGTILGAPYMLTVNAGTGFTFAAGASDTSTYNWVIIDLI